MVRNIRVHTVTTFEWGSPERSHCADSIFQFVSLLFFAQLFSTHRVQIWRGKQPDELQYQREKKDINATPGLKYEIKGKNPPPHIILYK